MGQKVNPHGLRLKIVNDWKSRWFATKDYSKLLQEDIFIREYLESRLSHAAISKIEIERASNQLTVDIFTARPGVVIGKKGSEVDQIRGEIEKRTGKLVQLNILEVPRPELDARLVATNVAEQLIGRISFRRAMKRAVAGAIRAGAQGIKINCAGRLGGAEMARTEWYREGRVPLHTLKADIDYAVVKAKTTFGIIGVKVWIYKGDIERKRRELEVVPEAKGEKFETAVEAKPVEVPEIKEEKSGTEIKPEEKVEAKPKAEVKEEPKTEVAVKEEEIKPEAETKEETIKEEKPAKKVASDEKKAKDAKVKKAPAKRTKKEAKEEE